MARAYVCPGQGAQAIGMGKALADEFSEARAVFEEVDDVVKVCMLCCHMLRLARFQNVLDFLLLQTSVNAFGYWALDFNMFGILQFLVVQSVENAHAAWMSFLSEFYFIMFRFILDFS